MLVVETAPATEPISTADMKSWLKIESSITEDDALISALIQTARIDCENYTGRKLITQTLSLTLQSLPQSKSTEWWDGVRQGCIASLGSTVRDIPLETAPIQSISSFKYYLEDNTETTFDSSNYALDIASFMPRLVLNDNKYWPSASLRSFNAIKITFIAGYGLTGASVPQSLISAMKMMVTRWYEGRGDIESLTKKSADAEWHIPPAAQVLMNSFVVGGV